MIEIFFVILVGSILLTAISIHPVSKQIGVMEITDLVIDSAEQCYPIVLNNRRFFVYEDFDSNYGVILPFEPKEPSKHSYDIKEGVAC